MTAPELKSVSNTVSTDLEEEYSIPLDLSDIINICREYNNLGWQIQNQVENILDLGVEEAIKIGVVKKQSIPFIKGFLKSIYQNPYFGDASSQANDCIKLISKYEEKQKVISLAN